MIEAAAAIVAWLGASLVVLADGRRGLAVGVALTTAGLGAIAFVSAGPLAAGALAVGGAVAAARRLTAGPEGWGIMPAGSTPRFVLCVAVAVVAAWFALAATTGAGAGLRFAAVAVLALAGGRVLSSSQPDVLLTAIGVFALAIAAASALPETSAQPWPYLAAGLVAAGACWVPVRQTNAAT